MVEVKGMVDLSGFLHGCYFCGPLDSTDDVTEACVDGLWKPVCWGCRDRYADASMAAALDGDPCDRQE